MYNDPSQQQPQYGQQPNGQQPPPYGQPQPGQQPPAYGQQQQYAQPQYGQQQYGYAQPQLQYISVWPRAIAVIIDGILLGVVLDLLVNVIFQNAPSIGLILGLIIYFGYFIVMEAMLGSTLGKMVLRLRVVKTDGSPISWSESVIRNLLRIIDALPTAYLIGAILVWTSPLRQRLGDRAAKTVVVRR